MSEAVIGMIGVIIGGGITTTGTVWAQRLQAKNNLRAERRAREITASSAALSAIGQLITLSDAPDGAGIGIVQRAEWKQARQGQLLLLDIATQDLGHAELRVRLDEVRRLLDLYDGATFYTGQTEPTLRIAVCAYAVDCLGAFRRGETLPARPEAVTESLESLAAWLRQRSTRTP